MHAHLSVPAHLLKVVHILCQLILTWSPRGRFFHCSTMKKLRTLNPRNSHNGIGRDKLGVLCTVGPHGPHHAWGAGSRNLCFPHSGFFYYYFFLKLSLSLLESVWGKKETFLGSPDILFWNTFSNDGSIPKFWASIHLPSPQMPLGHPARLLPLASLLLEDSSESPFGHSPLIAHNYPSSWSYNKQEKG